MNSMRNMRARQAAWDEFMRRLYKMSKELGSLESWIESASEAKGKLPIQPHETPAEGLERIYKKSMVLEEENAEDVKRIGELEAKIDDTK